MTDPCPLALRSTPIHGAIALAAEPIASAQRDRYQVTLTAGPEGFSGVVALVLALPDAAQPPWWLLPGAFYGDNRARGGAQRWPCWGEDADGEFVSPAWDFALDRTAAPLLIAHDGSAWRGLDWTPHYQVSGAAAGRSVWGDSEPQVGLGLTWSNGSGELRLNVPANEAPRRHARNPHHQATDRRLDLPPGASIQFAVGVWDQIGPRESSAGILRTVSEELSVEHPAHLPATVTELADAASHGLLAWHWIDDPGYWVYTAAYDRSAEFNANNKGTTLGWHFEALGFVGGFAVAFGLLWQATRRGDERARDVAERCLARWVDEGLSEWGLFRTSYHPGQAVTPNGRFPNPAPVGPANSDASGNTPFYGSCWHPQHLLHARTVADAVLYAARCLELLPAGDLANRVRATVRSNLTVALELQDEVGRFGQIYHVEERRVARSQGSGGLLWIPALLAAEPQFADDPAFQAELAEAAQRAGRGYQPDVEAGWIVGAPEDVDLAPTSEDGYNAVMAYAALARRFGHDDWLATWRLAADWTLTWRKAYNVRFPPRNILAQGDFRSVGGDFASSHNNHLHVYGCNCLADFHALAKATGDRHYARRANEHFAFTAQLLAVEDGQWNAQRGMASEQFYTTDWSIWGDWDPTEHHVQKGTLMGFSHVWCINMILLGLEQLEQAGVSAEPS